MNETPPRPSQNVNVNISAGLPLKDAARLRELAAQRNTTVSNLLRTAIEATFGTAEQPKHT